MAFKIVEDPYGTLTFMRIYQGTIRQGRHATINQRTGRKERFSRIVRMHADQREDIDYGRGGRHRGRARASTAASGDTYCSRISLLHAGEHVRARAGHQDGHRSGEARRGRPAEQGPAPFPPRRPHACTSPPTRRRRETIIAGMGELHLEIYVERIRREYGVEVEVGAPKVNYREAPTQAAEFNTKHRKQTGGSGQYAHIVGRLEPLPEDADETVRVRGGGRRRADPQAVHPGRSRRVFAQMVHKGPVAGYPVVGLNVYRRGRFVSRRRQFGHGVPDLCPDLHAGELFRHAAGAAGAGDEDRDRVSHASSRVRWWAI